MLKVWERTEVIIKNIRQVLTSAIKIACEPTTIEEVRDAIAKLRNGRAPGEDLISAELWWREVGTNVT